MGGKNRMENISISSITSVSDNLFKLLLDADSSKNIVQSYLKRAYKFIAIFKGAPVGIVLLIDTRPETIEIINIAVSKDYRNQGIGGKLLEYSIKWAKSKKYRVIEIGTGSTSFGQLYLYQKYGFRPVSIDRDFFVTHYPHRIIENKLVLKDMVRLQQYLF